MTDWHTARGLLRAVLQGVFVLVTAVVVVSACLAALPAAQPIEPEEVTSAPFLQRSGAASDHDFLDRLESYLLAASTFQFGYSDGTGLPVARSVFSALRTSVVLILGGVTLLLLLGLPVGMRNAVRPDSKGGGVLSFFLLVISGVPLLLWVVLAIKVFDGFDYSILGGRPSQNSLHSMIRLIGPALPLAVGDGLLADLIRRVQIDTESALREPYMRTVKGLNLGFRRHLLRSITPGMADLIASRALFLVGGAIVVEWILQLEGIGYLTLDALETSTRDPGMILAASMGLVVLGLFLRWGGQIVGGLADPRRLKGGGR